MTNSLKASRQGQEVLSKVLAKTPPIAWAIAPKNDEPSALRVESQA
jgi:hypothetical protein